MKRLQRWILAGGLTALLSVGAGQVLAQNGGGGAGGAGGGRGGGGPGGGRGFDPAQFQQRMMERYKEMFEITDDTEWKAIQPLVQKVMDARMAVGMGMGGRGMMGRGPRPGGDNPPGGDQAQRRNFGPPADPDAEALQKAVDAKASNAEMKAAMQKYAESRKQKQAALEKAQADLRKVLTPRQEAAAMLGGLL
jgi:hypothetical protein